MEERDFFEEREDTKPATLSCFYCRQAETYDIRWLVRMKKASLPSRAGEEDRLRFSHFRSYMLRRDDVVQCKNPRCRKRFDISGVQS
ncbi:MAG: hypothetical protein KGM47_01785, partial [Acidobacteriota bacterium]|nr:hypothetical protein [Acidobacteriota bacterium]